MIFYQKITFIEMLPIINKLRTSVNWANVKSELQFSGIHELFSIPKPKTILL